MMETAYPTSAWLLSFVVAAAAGTIPCTVLVPRILGHGDPRTSGSGTPGVANVAMSVGYGAGIAVALPFEVQAFSAFYLWRRSIVGSDAQHYRLPGELSD